MQKEVISFAESIRRKKICFSFMIEGKAHWCVEDILLSNKEFLRNTLLLNNPGGCTRMQKEVISVAESIRRKKIYFSFMIEGKAHWCVEDIFFYT